MSVSMQQTIYEIAHTAPGKVPALAARMGKNEGTLYHKLNPNNGTHGLNPDEIETLVDYAGGNETMARYFANKAGFLLIPMIEFDGSDTCLLDGYMEIIKELGEFSQEFQKSWADGRITNKELNKIKAEMRDVMTKLAAFVNRVEQIAE